MSKRSEAASLWLIGVFLLSMPLGPIGGSTVAQALLAFLHRQEFGARA